METQGDSGGLKVFFPLELLEKGPKDFSECVFVGWEGHNGQLYIVSAYPSSKFESVRSALDSTNRGSELRSLTFMRNGLEHLHDLNFVRKRDKRRRLCVSLHDPDTGREVEELIVFLYGNKPFDYKGTTLFDNLKVHESQPEEFTHTNSDVGSCLVLATTLKRYLDGEVGRRAARADDGPTLRQINSSNRRSNLSSFARYLLHILFIKLTYCLSLVTFHLLRVTNNGSKLGSLLLSSSNLLSHLVSKLEQISLWHKAYRDLLHKTEITEYIRLMNELTDIALSFYLDWVAGFLVFFCFRRAFMATMFEVRGLCKGLYIEKLKWLFYFLSTKIFMHIKFNNEVSTSLSKFVINNILFWKYVGMVVRPLRVALFKGVEYSCLFGLSAMLAFICDVFALETMHLFYLYFIILAIMNYCQKYLYSLLQLFKGKKWNILKSVLDTNQFTKEQLFIGVVFFTIFTLNYPTIWVFYISIIVILLPALVLKALVLTLVEVVSGFPYYMAMWNAFGAKKYTQGVYFRHLFESSQKPDPDGSLSVSIAPRMDTQHLYLEVRPNKMSLANRAAMVKQKVAERLSQVSPMTILRKILKCYNIFGK